MDAATSAQLFTHLRILMGTVVGLAMARLLIGFAGIIQHPGRAKLYSPHLIWAGAMLLTMVHFWWWEFALIQVTSWTFGAFLFLIAYSTSLFLICALLFPDSLAEYDGYEGFFLSRRVWFFGLFALTIVFDIFDTAIKGPNYFAGFGLEYMIEVPVGLALCVVGMVTRNRGLQLALAIIQIGYQISWVARLFYSPV
jgi:hypothetical protein